MFCMKNFPSIPFLFYLLSLYYPLFPSFDTIHWCKDFQLERKEERIVHHKLFFQFAKGQEKKRKKGKSNRVKGKRENESKLDSLKWEPVSFFRTGIHPPFFTSLSFLVLGPFFFNTTADTGAHEWAERIQLRSIFLFLYDFDLYQPTHWKKIEEERFFILCFASCQVVLFETFQEHCQELCTCANNIRS